MKLELISKREFEEIFYDYVMRIWNPHDFEKENFSCFILIRNEDGTWLEFWGVRENPLELKWILDFDDVL